MSKMSRGLVLVLWIASLVVAAQWGASAQQIPLVPKGTVLSGPDLGFRVDKVANGKATGAFVVKINGQWAEVGGGAMVPLVAR